MLARQRRNPPPDIVLGGSDAAEEHEVPVGAPEATMHAYIGAGRYDAFSEAAGGPMTAPPDGANLIVHLLEDWPFRSEQRHTPLFVAWLDMADEDQRGADLVERRLLTRR